MNDASAAEPVPAPPAPPRAITRAACRRAWGEGRVRLWWMSAIAVAVITAYFIVTTVAAGLRERALLKNGLAIQATVDTAMGGKLQHLHSRGASIPVRLSFVLPDGREHLDSEDHWLAPVSGERLRVGDSLPIRVDAGDPERWVEDRDPAPWGRQLTMAWILLPLLAALVLIAWVKRQSVLRVWRDGEAAEAVVIDTTNSALSPSSQSLRVALKQGRDKRVFTLLHPRRAGTLSPGETLWVILPPGKPHQSIEAKAYEE